ncbi:MAG: hypothetical protein AB7U45_03760 [Desulfamplus sp.]
MEDVKEPIKTYYKGVLAARRSYNEHSQHTGLWHVRILDEHLRKFFKIAITLDQEDQGLYNFITKLACGKTLKEIKNDKDNVTRFQMGLAEPTASQRFDCVVENKKYYTPNVTRYITNGIVSWRMLHSKTQISTLRYAVRCQSEFRKWSWKTQEILECVKKRVAKILQRGTITKSEVYILKLHDKLFKTGSLKKFIKDNLHNSESGLKQIFRSNGAFYNKKEVIKMNLITTFFTKSSGLTKRSKKWKEKYAAGCGFNNRKTWIKYTEKTKARLEGMISRRIARKEEENRVREEEERKTQEAAVKVGTEVVLEGEYVNPIQGERLARGKVKGALLKGSLVDTEKIARECELAEEVVKRIAEEEKARLDGISLSLTTARPKDERIEPAAETEEDIKFNSMLDNILKNKRVRESKGMSDTEMEARKRSMLGMWACG